MKQESMDHNAMKLLNRIMGRGGHALYTSVDNLVEAPEGGHFSQLYISKGDASGSYTLSGSSFIDGIARTISFTAWETGVEVRGVIESFEMTAGEVVAYNG